MAGIGWQLVISLDICLIYGVCFDIWVRLFHSGLIWKLANFPFTLTHFQQRVTWTNSVDPDEMPPKVTSHLGLHYLADVKFLQVQVYPEIPLCDLSMICGCIGICISG